MEAALAAAGINSVLSVFSNRLDVMGIVKSKEFTDSSLAVLNMVIDQVDSAITGQITLQSNLGEDLVEIKTKLEALKAVLTEYEGQIITDATVWQWLDRLKDAMYTISDGINEFKSNRKPAAAQKVALAGMIKTMKDKLNSITNQDDISRFRENSTSNIHQRTHSDTLESELIGRNEEILKMMERLSGSIKKQITILPIYGIGGVGKTTLATMVFSSAQFNDYCRVWVYVSPTFDSKKIGNSIISQVSKHESLLVEMDMIHDRLQELLTGNKILIVLDDLWEEDPSRLQDLKSMLEGGEVVVLVTTRDEAIARGICTVEPYKLGGPFTDRMCWSIIKQTTGFESRDDKELLEEIGMDIAKRCAGMPLLAHSVGRILKLVPSYRWMLLRDSHMKNYFGYFVHYTQDAVLASLLFSYNRMPPYLRLCFAYCAVLPEGHCIVKEDLIHQLIALGFIEPSSTLSPTQIGENYVRRLLELSFLQYANTSSSETCGKDEKGATLFSVPHLMHSLARLIMNSELTIVKNNGTASGNEYSRYALLTHCDPRPLELSSISLARMRALHLLGSSKMELRDNSFLSARCLRVLEFKESYMQKLPGSICLLRHLGHLNLSGCSRLVTLPKSFGDLVNLLYINLSGCSRLVSLPESFGNLINLLHINLSSCSRLAKLPESISKLTKLVYLDLSFWYCFKGISGVLARLTSLQHLNLGYPSCSCAEHRYALERLSGVLEQLTQLKYLNLSMFLNNTFYYKLETDCPGYIESCISGLSSLEHLDLSHNIYLSSLPENPGSLNMLHTLDLSGCIRLKTIPKKMYEMNCLKLVVLKNCRDLESYQFVVRVDDGPYSSCSNLVQLEVVDCKELEISCLEKVKSLEEAQRIRLVDKKNIRTLKLHWSVGAAQGSVELDKNDLLGELVPPRSLQCLELHGYGGITCLPAWWTPSISSRLTNLVEVTMKNFPRCTILPPLGVIPNLQRLVLRDMPNITTINFDDLSGGGGQELDATCYTDGEEFLDSFEEFPVIDELVIKECPKLSFGPLPPRARRLLLSDCEKVMSSWQNSGGVEGSCASVTTELVVEKCNVPSDGPSLLHRLSGLQKLIFSHCDDMTSLPEDLGDLKSLQYLKIVCCKQINRLPNSMKQLSSLQSIYFSECERMGPFPEWFERLTSLMLLTIDRCPAIESLPQSICTLANLKGLDISGCPILKTWCESDENKNKLAHIRLKFEEIGTSSAGQ